MSQIVSQQSAVFSIPEEPVQKIHEQPHSNCVTALFADRELSFVLPKGATLEDLAGRLASLRAGTPVAINVRFDS
jgi:hypothetical protein